MIKVSRTYEVITPESVEHGEVAESGFDYQEERVNFRELIGLIQDHPMPSCSHGIPNWTSSYPETDYRTGAETIYSIHPAQDAISQKYWAKACRIVGITKRG
jgi:hypothetical protein